MGVETVFPRGDLLDSFTRSGCLVSAAYLCCNFFQLFIELFMSSECRHSLAGDLFILLFYFFGGAWDILIALGLDRLMGFPLIMLPRGTGVVLGVETDPCLELHL